MIQHDKRFLSRRKLVTSIIVFDGLFKFLNCQFQVLSQNIRSLYKPLIPFDYNYWYNIFEKSSIKTKNEKWPSRAFFTCFIVTEALNLLRNTVIVSVSLLVANILLVVLIEDLDTLLRNFILMGGFLKLGLLDLD